MTDVELAKLEKRIAAIYREAYNDLADTIRDYFGKFAARDAAEKARMDAGEISEDQYKLWRAAQIGRGKRFEALRDKVAERMTNANATAIAYINDATPGIYSLNRNLAAYAIEQVIGDVGFDLWDERVVKRLIAEQPGLFTRLTGGGGLIKAGTRINWQGTVKRAASDLWDTPQNTPDAAPALWEDIQYKQGYRIIPETITTLGMSMLRNCVNLATINIQTNVTEIPDRFAQESGRTSVTLPDTVETIGDSAFSSSRANLTEITIPASVTSIGDYAFAQNESMTTITCLAATPPTLGRNAFIMNTINTTIKVPAASVAAYKAAAGWSTWADIIVAM